MRADPVRFDQRLRENLTRRARILALLREWFARHGFLEVETPILCSSPGVEAHLHAFETQARGRHLYLTTSPEFHMKRLLAVGFDRVFQVTRAFRDGERGDLHNPEFAMIEWYRAGVGYEAILEDCEALVHDLAVALYGREVAPAVPGVRAEVSLRRPFRRRTFRQVFAEAGVLDALALPVEARLSVFVEQVEPGIGRHQAEFLVEYPADMASLARLNAADPTVAERFELYAGGLEIANGFSEITDVEAFLERCEAHRAERRRLGLPDLPWDERYVAMLREERLPPCAGVALGLDRLGMLLIGAARIDDVIAFPIEEA